MNKLLLGTTLVVGLALSLSACKQASNSNSLPMKSSQQTASSTQGTIEKQTADYHVMVMVPNPPLKTQAETYTLQIQDLKANKPIEAPPEVKMEMPMGNTPMIAPTTVSKSTKSGEFQVNTEFTMAGDWILQIKPAQSREAITLTLSVQ